MQLPYTQNDVRPVLRPHVRVERNQVYFLQSRRPWLEWSPHLEKALEVVDGDRTVEECSRAAGTDLSVTFEAMWSAGMIELLEPPPVGPRQKILVIEPHMDDAILSLGGTMFQRRNEVEFTILTMAGRSNFTSYYYLDRPYLNADTVSALRIAESRLVARMLHGQHVELGLLEAPLRYHSDVDWDLDWFRVRRRHVGAFISHVSHPREEAQWSEALEDHLDSSRYDELWFNLGVGTHTDHDLTRNAVLRLMTRRQELFRRQPVRFYQDVPYAGQFPHHTQLLVTGLSRLGLELRPEVVEVEDVFEDKLRLVSVYGSQFKIGVLQPRIEACARQISDGTARRSELLFEVTGSVSGFDQLALHGDFPRIRPSLTKVREWMDRTRRKKTLHILAVSALGRPCEDLRELQELLPGVTIEVYVSERHASDAHDLQAEGFRARVVSRSRLAWLSLIARLALSDDALLILRHPTGTLRSRLLPRLAPRPDKLELHLLSHLLLVARSSVEDLQAPSVSR